MRETGLAERVTTICHDLTDDTQSGLVDGVLDFVIHQPRQLLATATVSALFEAVTAARSFDGDSATDRPVSPPNSAIVPFELYSVENI